MWLECVSDRVYDTREALADDLVGVLREEIEELLAAGAALVRLDEPVPTEVVHGRPSGGDRSFMCGAHPLSIKGGGAGGDLAIQRSKGNTVELRAGAQQSPTME